MNHLELRRYYRQIRCWLPCGGKVSKDIMSRVRNSVEHYLQGNPDADIQQLRAHFGEPETIAASFVEHANTKDILVELHTQRKITRIVACAILAALLIWGAFVGYAMWSYPDHIPAYYETEAGLGE